MVTRVSWFVLALLASPLIAQSGARSEARVVAGFRRIFLAENPTAKTVEEKTQALADLAGLDSARVARALLAAYRNLEREADPLRQKRKPILLRGGGSKALRPYRRKIQPIANLQRKILVALGTLRAPQALQAMLRELLTSRSNLPMMLEIAIARRAGDLPEDGMRMLLDASRASPKTSKVKRARFALPVLTALRHGGRRAIAAAPFAVKQLAHDYLDVRIEAARTLAALCWPGAIELLIARAKIENGRVQTAVFDALTKLTGQNPGRSASAWRRWLAAEGGPYLRGEIRLGRDAPKRRRGPRKPAPGGTGSYFGIPQDGDSILYVFDNSQSMKQPMPGRRRQKKPVTRMDRCRRELHHALDTLTPQQTFNLLAFANKLRAFAPAMQPARKATIAKAHAWIDGLQLEFQTNIHDALELSFYLAGRGTEDEYYPLEADTIFLLSDGAPTIPKPKGGGITRDNVDEILAAVHRWNPLRRMVIHTIGLGVRRGRQPRATEVREFMARLASQNGGKFVIPD